MQNKSALEEIQEEAEEAQDGDEEPPEEKIDEALDKLDGVEQSPAQKWAAAVAQRGRQTAQVLEAATEMAAPLPTAKLSTLGKLGKLLKRGGKTGDEAADTAEAAVDSEGAAIQVTKSGVALPPGAKYQIPDGYVQNPHRSGSYGEVVDGKFRERLRIDPPTSPGHKGPNYSHYHRDGKGTHYSPQPGDQDPGFGP